MRYVLARDLIIPSGTVVSAPPTASTRWGKDFEAVVGIDKDHICYLSIDRDEGVESGLLLQIIGQCTVDGVTKPIVLPAQQTG